MSSECSLGSILRKYSGLQLFFLTFLRVVVGWHFLYEGYVKVTNEGWSAVGYLNATPGPFSAMFSAMAGNADLVSVINFIMSYGMLLVGLSLLLGIFSRTGALAGAMFLLLFYLSNPPWVGVQAMPGEGSYLIVNKNMVEMAALLVLVVFPAGMVWGLDRLFARE